MSAPGDPSNLSGPPPRLTPGVAIEFVSEPPSLDFADGRSSSPARDLNSLRVMFEDSETLDVRVSGMPSLGDPHTASSQIYLRAYDFGVTLEAEGRYTARASGELGRGAIGRVYVAEDAHLGRQVAIKELLEGVTDAADGPHALQTISRFLREARVTGALEHPNIVPVYELGRRADGTLYYTMRIVPGRTLAQAIADFTDIGERLSLVNHFSGLCQAIAYAHSRGIVHRDIKPDNVMIGEFGETVVLDWGMAKLCNDERDERAKEASPPRHDVVDLGLTQEGSLCGTPLYMSPEQVSGRTRDVDQRSDVWSLGVVLYTILAGRTPFSGNSMLEIAALINAGRYTELRRLEPRIPAELAAVVERALQPKQLDRYPSARELARDIQAYQAGMRVTAYEYSSLELLQRFAARHRSAVTASLLAFLIILGLSFTAYRRVVAARDRAIVAEQHALENELAARHSAEHARRSLGEVLLERAEQALSEENSVDAELLAARALGQEERADARGVVIAAESTLRPALSRTLLGSKGCTRTAVSFAAGMFACVEGRSLRLLSLGERNQTLNFPLTADAVGLAFASDASTLVVSLADGTLSVRRASFADEPWRSENCGKKPTAVAVARDGQALACGDSRGRITVWRAKSVQHLLLGQAVSALHWSSDGALLAVGGELGGLLIYDTADQSQRRLVGHTGTVLALALADQGRYLLSGAADRMLRFWDTQSGAQLQAPIVHSDVVSALGWSDDRRFVALAGKDKTFRVLDLRTGHGSLTRQPDEAVELAAISGNGSELASYSHHLGLRLWSQAAQQPFELKERGNVLALALGSRPGQLLSAGLGHNGVCLWELENGACAARLPVRLDRVRALAVSSDRQKLALAGSGTQIFVWDLSNKMPIEVIEGLRDETRALCFSLDGRRLAAAGLDRKLRVFDVTSAALVREVDTSTPIQTMSLVPESGALITGDQGGAITIWDLKTGQTQASFQAHADWVLGSAVSPDGTLLASAGADRLVKIWNLQTRKRTQTLTGHDGKVLSLDFSRSGALLASAGEDKSVRLWDVSTGRPLATLNGHAGVVRSVRFTDQATLLASGSDDGAIRLWHLDALTRSSGELEESVLRAFDLKAVAGSEREAPASARPTTRVRGNLSAPLGKPW